MNSSVVAVRYAKAFLEYVAWMGREAQVCDEVCAILDSPDSISEKQPGPEISRLVSLLLESGREDILKYVLRDFVSLYYQKMKIKTGVLKTAVPIPSLTQRMIDLASDATGCDVKLRTEIDPDIVGGFVLTLDGVRLDASVSRQIDLIRRDLVLKNKKKV